MFHTWLFWEVRHFSQGKIQLKCSVQEIISMLKCIMESFPTITGTSNHSVTWNEESQEKPLHFTCNLNNWQLSFQWCREVNFISWFDTWNKFTLSKFMLGIFTNKLGTIPSILRQLTHKTFFPKDSDIYKGAGTRAAEKFSRGGSWQSTNISLAHIQSDWNWPTW